MKRRGFLRTLTALAVAPVAATVAPAAPMTHAPPITSRYIGYIDPAGDMFGRLSDGSLYRVTPGATDTLFVNGGGYRWVDRCDVELPYA